MNLKYKINESELKNIIGTCVKKCINEIISNYKSGVFNGDKELEYLEDLVKNFTHNYVNEDDWSEFVDGVLELYYMSKEMDTFRQNNITNDNYEEYRDFNYIDDYLDDMEMWNNNMPSSEEIKKLIIEFKRWLNQYVKLKIYYYQQNINNEFGSYIKQLDRI